MIIVDNVNYGQLVDKLLQSAERGDAKSQYHLGVLYHNGQGVQKDYVIPEILAVAAAWIDWVQQAGKRRVGL